MISIPYFPWHDKICNDPVNGFRQKKSDTVYTIRDFYNGRLMIFILIIGINNEIFFTVGRLFIGIVAQPHHHNFGKAASGHGFH